MRAALALLALLLLSPTTLAGDDDLGPHLAKGGQLLVRLSETGSAHAASTTEGEPEEGRSEVTRRAWDSAWAWNLSASVGSANGRLVGIATLERSIRAASTHSRVFEAYAGDELAVRQETNARCEMALPAGPSQGGLTGRVDTARGVLVLEITGITSARIPADAWSPCERTTKTYSWTDGTEESTEEETGPSELALSAHAIEPRASGKSVIVVEVPLAVGETPLPAGRAFDAGPARGYCEGEWPAEACVVEGTLLVRIEKGATTPSGIAPASGEDATPANEAAGASALAGEPGSAAEEAQERGTPFAGPALVVVAAAAALVARRR